jgi:two-component system, chemotaxis family, protein-glutamate methylesterase/glutaminase
VSPPHRDLIVVGASAGGVEALRTLVRGLPADLPASVLVVLHLPEDSPSALAGILDRSGPLPASTASDGAPLRPGTVTVAPSGHHLLVRDGTVGLSRGPRENGHRPAVDVLFRSAAVAAGRRVIGVVLSGTLDDGTAGLAAIRAAGGVGVVQDPATAMYDAMPRHALQGAGADHVAPVAGIPDVLAGLVAETLGDGSADPPPPAGPGTPSGAGSRVLVPAMNLEAQMADAEPDALGDTERLGAPAPYSCPDCSGTLYEVEAGTLLRYRCRVGHAWSADSLLSRQGSVHEEALWMALRSLQERAALSRELAHRARERGHHVSAAQFHRSGEETARAAALVRDLLTAPDLPVAPDQPGQVAGS